MPFTFPKGASGETRQQILQLLESAQTLHPLRHSQYHCTSSQLVLFSQQQRNSIFLFLRKSVELSCLHVMNSKIGSYVLFWRSIKNKINSIPPKPGQSLKSTLQRNLNLAPHYMDYIHEFKTWNSFPKELLPYHSVSPFHQTAVTLSGMVPPQQRKILPAVVHQFPLRAEMKNTIYLKNYLWIWSNVLWQKTSL